MNILKQTKTNDYTITMYEFNGDFLVSLDTKQNGEIIKTHTIKADNLKGAERAFRNNGGTK